MSTSDDESVEYLRGLAKTARDAVDTIRSRSGEIETIGFFDLSGSTRAKLERGNETGSREALAFTGLATEITVRHGGRVIKLLGDGALVSFRDPIAACRAALHLRFATEEFLELEMSAGLTAGRPRVIDLGSGVLDLLGDAVDRAARIQGLALTGQVLIDGPLRDIVRADVAGIAAWDLEDEPRRSFAKGIGDINLFEIVLANQWQARNQLATPFEVIASGRPSVAQKLALIRNARSEIIEIGIGLTSFARYFRGQKPGEFRDPIRALIRGGVDLTCYALDPAHEAGVAWLVEQGDPNYRQDADRAREEIEQEARYHRQSHSRGRMRYRTYQRVPEFWCLGVDVDDAVDGRMFFAPYLMDVARSQNPVLQVSRTSNTELFETLMTSVNAVRGASDAPRG